MENSKTQNDYFEVQMNKKDLIQGGFIMTQEEFDIENTIAHSSMGMHLGKLIRAYQVLENPENMVLTIDSVGIYKLLLDTGMRDKAQLSKYLKMKIIQREEWDNRTNIKTAVLEAENKLHHVKILYV